MRRWSQLAYFNWVTACWLVIWCHDILGPLTHLFLVYTGAKKTFHIWSELTALFRGSLASSRKHLPLPVVALKDWKLADTSLLHRTVVRPRFSITFVVASYFSHAGDVVYIRALQTKLQCRFQWEASHILQAGVNLSSEHWLHFRQALIGEYFLFQSA